VYRITYYYYYYYYFYAKKNSENYSDDANDPLHAAVTSFPSAAFAFAIAIVPASTPSQNSIHAGKTVSFQYYSLRVL